MSALSFITQTLTVNFGGHSLTRLKGTVRGKCVYIPSSSEWGYLKLKLDARQCRRQCRHRKFELCKRISSRKLKSSRFYLPQFIRCTVFYAKNRDRNSRYTVPLSERRKSGNLHSASISGESFPLFFYNSRCRATHCIYGLKNA